MEVGYLDESGFALTLPPTYAWCRRGEAKGVPRAWGKEGRVNVVGHLVRGREGERLFFALLEGPVRWEVVRGYLDRVAEGLTKPLKVFLDNAPFHRSRGVEGRRGVWRGRGLEVAYLPRYSPHLNPMENIWRRVKGSLMPRRHYGSLEELKDAVVQALKALGGVELKILGEGTYILKAKDKHVYASPDPKDPVARIFGLAPENDEKSLAVARERGPTRLLVRDAYLTEDAKEALERTSARGGLYTEIKQEVFIPRLGGNANPRTTERVPAGARFKVEMTYRVLDDLDEEYFGKYLLRALELLELDGLGGHISRGYGQVYFLHPERLAEDQEGWPLRERLKVEEVVL